MAALGAFEMRSMHKIYICLLFQFISHFPARS